MEGYDEISLENAKSQFTKLMRHLNKVDQKHFISFVLKEWQPINVIDFKTDTYNSYDKVQDGTIDDPIFILNAIADDIKGKVPFSAVLPSENIKPPISGENSDCDPSKTLHIDEFLYNDEDVNELVDAGKLKKYYCQDCGSKNTDSFILISHSMSKDGLYYIFNTLLPTLNGKTILDIGSRLGAVLYGAYVYTDAARIIGVEMNEELCKLQNDIIRKYKMEEKIEIHHQKIEDVPELVRESDVIVINNSFEFYTSKQDEINIWNFLKATIKPGTLLVVRPRMEVTFKHLQTDISMDEWVKPLEPRSDTANSVLLQSIIGDDPEKYTDIMCYKVL